MKSSHLFTPIAVTFGVGLLAGCASDPSPPQRAISAPSVLAEAPHASPNVEVVSSIEAAVETYQAFVDASNAVSAGDAGALSVLQSVTTREVAQSEQDMRELYASQGVTIEGSYRTVSLASYSPEWEPGDVLILGACSDPSDVVWKDSSGAVVDVGTADPVSLVVALSEDSTAPYGWIIQTIQAGEAEC